MKSAGAWTAWIKSRRTPKALYRTFKAGRRPRGARTVPPSHLQPHRPHQLQRIALLHHTRMQPVVERHAPVLELVLEVHIRAARRERFHDRSEEHTSELQSLRPLVCRLLLEK